MTTTVQHGCDQSGTSSQRPTNPPDGFAFYDTTLRDLIVWDETIENWFSTTGKMLYSASSPRLLSDDFKGADLDARWVKTVGTDPQAVAAAHTAGKHNGEVVLTSGDAGSGTAADAATLAGPALEWEAEEGEMTWQWKAKVDNIANVAFFIGLTDVLPSTTLELPASLSVATYTTTATDAVGFLFDTAATDDTIRAVGVADDTDATHVDTEVEPVNDTYAIYKLIVDTDGTATFYIDGTLVATVEDAVSVDVDLVPIAIVEARTTATRSLTVDYVSGV